MRSRFLVLLLVGLLPSLFLGCGASTQTPAPAPPLPASIQTPPPAPPPLSAPTPVQSPPVEDKVEVRFDRFENSTTVIFPSIRQLVPRAKKQLTPVWFASFRGQTPPPTPLLLSFWQFNKTWQYLRCHSLAILADGSAVRLPPAEHEALSNRTT